ncbi:hypothetical protein COU01_04560 [Candidatus Falkowbacteria bacterium CG10_big_fil_rev_8_21_14_0_10_44_15]|uniref:UPF0102 protein COU01_04560 n=1 Tax=Candidatus Falkowbacteria bacterium CG10_big_fil_rev_8_21_14_0_10_44_15 TaxID=1974569 RepID=A0A2H0UYM5_9BACT|nr:MAG: hypothetical protein COU01_04560 [Candidatus Falkowbacteria bacterium CG10_big_fil_rev_8_21_14_0_10_44_15]
MNQNQQVGAFGEKLAGEYLIRRGYKVLDTNVKNSYQELDIVASQGQWLVFVEVKTRLSQAYGDGAEAMSQKKQTALKYAINKYIGAKKLWDKEPRGDLIIVAIDKYKKTAKIKHYQDIL